MAGDTPTPKWVVAWLAGLSLIAAYLLVRTWPSSAEPVASGPQANRDAAAVRSTGPAKTKPSTPPTREGRDEEIFDLPAPQVRAPVVPDTKPAAVRPSPPGLQASAAALWRREIERAELQRCWAEQDHQAVGSRAILKVAVDGSGGLSVVGAQGSASLDADPQARDLLLECFNRLAVEVRSSELPEGEARITTIRFAAP